MPPIHQIDGDVARPVPGYPNYRVYTTGDVYSLKTNKFLKQRPNGKGYNTYGLCKDGKAKTRTVHRLVAEAFLPNPDGLSDVDHIDHDRTNNDVRNLRWVSRSTNNRNASLSKANTSGHQGVRLNAYGKWQARWHDLTGKDCVKTCATKDEAIAYRAARVAECYARVTTTA